MKNGENTRKADNCPAAIRSSAAEYLTFVAASGENSATVEVRYQDENIWLTQRIMAVIYGVELNTINEHISKAYEDLELDEKSTIRKFRIVQLEGARQVERDVKHYKLQVAISVGFKVNSSHAIQFRKWVNQIAQDYTIQGWAIDTERLKNGGNILRNDYFERLLEKIREIRMSERLFYQKITDIYATAMDYDGGSTVTKEFFAKVQNKLHWAIHGNTAAELIYRRARHETDNMGLYTWEDCPNGKILKSDTHVAKNYLTEKELSSLRRIVSGYLDFAEEMAKRHTPMTMDDWVKHLDKILMANGKEILQDAGKISSDLAKEHADAEYDKYRIAQDKLFQSDFDRQFRGLLNRMDDISNGDIKDE
jgi:hypothetical protein